MSSHVIGIDIDVYSAFAVIFNILCLEVAYYCFTGICIISMILSCTYVLCIIPCVILLVSFVQS